MLIFDVFFIFMKKPFPKQFIHYQRYQKSVYSQLYHYSI